jgi:hypothetical protein
MQSSKYFNSIENCTLEETKLMFYLYGTAEQTAHKCAHGVAAGAKSEPGLVCGLRWREGWRVSANLERTMVSTCEQQCELGPQGRCHVPNRGTLTGEVGEVQFEELVQEL